MMNMTKTMIAVIQDENGATAIEYGLIAALVSVAAIAALTTLGTNLSAMFTTVASHLAGATSGA